MKKLAKLLTITAMALALSLNNFAMAKDASNVATGCNVAVVDVAKVVESSPTINALKIDRNNKINDLAAFVEKARTDVAKEPDAAKKKALENKYNKELNDRKNAMDSAYAQKLSDVDKEVTALIKTKSSKYDLVLTKSSVLDGGIDITSEVIKGLK